MTIWILAVDFAMQANGGRDIFRGNKSKQAEFCVKEGVVNEVGIHLVVFILFLFMRLCECRRNKRWSYGHRNSVRLDVGLDGAERKTVVLPAGWGGEARTKGTYKAEAKLWHDKGRRQRNCLPFRSPTVRAQVSVVSFIHKQVCGRFHLPREDQTGSCLQSPLKLSFLLSLTALSAVWPLS